MCADIPVFVHLESPVHLFIAPTTQKGRIFFNLPESFRLREAIQIENGTTKHIKVLDQWSHGDFELIFGDSSISPIKSRVQPSRTRLVTVDKHDYDAYVKHLSRLLGLSLEEAKQKDRNFDESEQQVFYRHFLWTARTHQLNIK